MKITTIKNNDFTVPVIDAVELSKEIKLRKILTDKKVTSTILTICLRVHELCNIYMHM